MKINGAYKFRTQAITGRLRLLFRYNSTIPVFVNGGWQPAFVDQMFVELGVTGGYKELFKGSLVVELDQRRYGAYIREAAYHKSSSGNWVLSFLADGYDADTNISFRARRLENMKINTFLGFVDQQVVFKRYPEISTNDIYAGWLLSPSDYATWESAFLLEGVTSPTAIKQSEFVSYLGGGVWGKYLNSEGTVFPYSEIGGFVVSVFFTEENEYLINAIKNSRSLSSNPSFTTETYLHPLFNIRKPWILPGFLYFPFLFSEDRKELIYVKIFVDPYSSSSLSIEEVYYAKFSDTGDILEDTFIVDLQYYKNLPDNHPDKLTHNDPIPELPFWRISDYVIRLFDTRSVQHLSRFRSGKIEWVDKEDLGSDVGISLTPEVIESLLTRDYFNVKITQWNGQRFTEPETKKYKVTPTNQDIIDFYKTNNTFNPDKYITSLNLFGIAFY